MSMTIYNLHIPNNFQNISEEDIPNEFYQSPFIYSGEKLSLLQSIFGDKSTISAQKNTRSNKDSLAKFKNKCYGIKDELIDMGKSLISPSKKEKSLNGKIHLINHKPLQKGRLNGQMNQSKRHKNANVDRYILNQDKVMKALYSKREIPMKFSRQMNYGSVSNENTLFDHHPTKNEINRKISKASKMLVKTPSHTKRNVCVISNHKDDKTKSDTFSNGSSSSNIDENNNDVPYYKTKQMPTEYIHDHTNIYQNKQKSKVSFNESVTVKVYDDEGEELYKEFLKDEIDVKLLYQNKSYQTAANRRDRYDGDIFDYDYLLLRDFANYLENMTITDSHIKRSV